MRRNEIDEQVSEMVFGHYDRWHDTLDIKVPLVGATIAAVTKERGASPVCEIHDYGIEGDKELCLPNVCMFIENVTEDCIGEIIRERGSHDFDREMFAEWCRRAWR